jgi:cytochrome c2
VKGASLALTALVSLAACKPTIAGPSWADLGNPQRGKAVISAAQCGACHEIPGIVGADGRVGPPLGGFGDRTIIAGLLPNTPSNLVRWLRRPQAVKPGDAMPDTGLSPQQANDVAGYLYDLKSPPG